jgi:N utilization substance protein A
VVLSRNNPEFLRKLFEVEVPEIKEGIVEIKAVARDPGSRSKIAVHSNDDKVDAVGACVGMKGSRVQSVVRELGGERIDVVLWSEDPIEFVTRALSPAQVVLAEMDSDQGKVTVVVADDQLSLAIGRGGQNARLAARLTNLKIDLINESQYAERLEFAEAPPVPVADIEGIGQKTRDRLVEAGYETADQVAAATVDDLTAISGIGAKMAAKILEAVEALAAVPAEAGAVEETAEADSAGQDLAAGASEEEEEAADEVAEEVMEQAVEEEPGQEAAAALDEASGEDIEKQPEAGGEPETGEDIEEEEPAEAEEEPPAAEEDEEGDSRERAV